MRTIEHAMRDHARRDHGRISCRCDSDVFFQSAHSWWSHFNGARCSRGPNYNAAKSKKNKGRKKKKEKNDFIIVFLYDCIM